MWAYLARSVERLALFGKFEGAHHLQWLARVRHFDDTTIRVISIIRLIKLHSNDKPSRFHERTMFAANVL